MKGVIEVINMEDWVTIRNLKKRNPNLGTRKIAKMLGVSRNTVKKALEDDVYSGYSRVKKANEEVSKFHDFIKESYLIKNQKVSVIISNIVSKGFTGSSASVYRYIRDYFHEIRNDINKRTYERYETLPGEQCQYDWTEYRLPIGGKTIKLYVHCLICGFSRYRIYDVTIDKSQSSILSVLEDGFIDLGGVCSRIQVDNAAQFIDDASVRNLKWNDTFLSFCGFYGIVPTRSLVRHPWSKGKVENPFEYLENHFINNNTFDSITDFHVKLKKFQAEVNNRVHSTIRAKPVDKFALDKASFLNLPATVYAGNYKEYRKVTSDCLISYKGNRYSVPYIFAGKSVWVKVYKGLLLKIYSDSGKLIAEHRISYNRGDFIIEKGHYKSHLYNEKSNYEKLSLIFNERFSSYVRGTDFLHSLKMQKGINARYHLSKILDIFTYYNDEICESVLDECFKYNKFNSNFIKGIILTQPQVNEPVTASINFESYPKGNTLKRNLKEYRLCHN